MIAFLTVLSIVHGLITLYLWSVAQKSQKAILALVDGLRAHKKIIEEQHRSRLTTTNVIKAATWSAK